VIRKKYIWLQASTAESVVSPWTSLPSLLSTLFLSEDEYYCSYPYCSWSSCSWCYFLGDFPLLEFFYFLLSSSTVLVFSMFWCLWLCLAWMWLLLWVISTNLLLFLWEIGNYSYWFNLWFSCLLWILLVLCESGVFVVFLL